MDWVSKDISVFTTSVFKIEKCRWSNPSCSKNVNVNRQYEIALMTQNDVAVNTFGFLTWSIKAIKTTNTIVAS